VYEGIDTDPPCDPFGLGSAIGGENDRPGLGPFVSDPAGKVETVDTAGLGEGQVRDHERELAALERSLGLGETRRTFHLPTTDPEVIAQGEPDGGAVFDEQQ
jgi:hypothetical protein